MKRKQLLLIHLSYWLYVFVVAEGINKLAYQGKIISWNDLIGIIPLSNYILFTTVFYINYGLVLPILWANKRYYLFIVTLLSILVLFVGLRYCIQEVIFLNVFDICNYCSDNSSVYFVNNFFQGLSVLILGSTVIWFIERWITNEKNRLRLEQEKFNAERVLLQSQANPHFLFNSLNNIYSLVYHNSNKSLDAISKLAGILRYSLKEAIKDEVELRIELDYLKNYIELQKLRIENAAVDYSETGTFQDKKVAPMLLLTFVENAFKHGILNDKVHPIQISVFAGSNYFKLTVVNKFQTRTKVASSGFGLSNIQRRLNLLYGDRHEFTTKNESNIYYSELKIFCR